jgi:hypothetical protein
MSVFVCLLRQWPPRAHGSDDIPNCCAGDLGVTLLDQQRIVIRPRDDAVDAIGGQRREFGLERLPNMYPF